MKLCGVCCTYNRPHLLAGLIHCFERQTYQDRELVILDDAGQYDPQTGDRWRIVSQTTRFQTLGEKRNACAALAINLCPELDAFVVLDDDDLYLTWHFSAAADALTYGDWCRPSRVLLIEPDGSFSEHPTDGIYHAGQSYRRELFTASGGYPPESGSEDQGLYARLTAKNPKEVDPFALGWRPSYVYASRQRGNNLTAFGCNQEAYTILGQQPIEHAIIVPFCPPEEATKAATEKR